MIVMIRNDTTTTTTSTTTTTTRIYGNGMYVNVCMYYHCFPGERGASLFVRLCLGKGRGAKDCTRGGDGEGEARLQGGHQGRKWVRRYITYDPISYKYKYRRVTQMSAGRRVGSGSRPGVKICCMYMYVMCMYVYIYIYI